VPDGELPSSWPVNEDSSPSHESLSHASSLYSHSYSLTNTHIHNLSHSSISQFLSVFTHPLIQVRMCTKTIIHHGRCGHRSILRTRCNTYVSRKRRYYTPCETVVFSETYYDLCSKCSGVPSRPSLPRFVEEASLRQKPSVCGDVSVTPDQHLEQQHAHSQEQSLSEEVREPVSAWSDDSDSDSKSDSETETEGITTSVLRLGKKKVTAGIRRAARNFRRLTTSVGSLRGDGYSDGKQTQERKASTWTLLARPLVVSMPVLASLSTSTLGPASVATSTPLITKEPETDQASSEALAREYMNLIGVHPCLQDDSSDDDESFTPSARANANSNPNPKANVSSLPTPGPTNPNFHDDINNTLETKASAKTISTTWSGLVGLSRAIMSA